eukprot:TRINITY_DN1039_c0_g1_i1.p1 TRINITY_DN1039_c0_g1~~TRINITY_DN1039_c0_g1_i1.p1  ORF type:complete len:438 (+),score=47.50 TRINITY_DN1039_c0_g1_i1:584-1897(+)
MAPPTTPFQSFVVPNTSFECTPTRWEIKGTYYPYALHYCKVKNFWVKVDPNGFMEYFVHGADNNTYPDPIAMPNRDAIRLRKFNNSPFYNHATKQLAMPQPYKLIKYTKEVPTFLFSSCLPNTWFTLRGCSLPMYHALKHWNLLDSNVRLVMLLDWPDNPPKNQTQMLFKNFIQFPLTDRPIEYLHSSKGTLYFFEEAYVGLNSLSMDSVPMNSSLVREWSDYVIDRYEAKTSETIRYDPTGKKPIVTFINRTKNRRFINLNEIVNFTKSLNFDVQVSEFYFEQDPIEQLRLMQNSTIFISAHGMQLSYMVFMRPNTSITEVLYKWGMTYKETYLQLSEASNIRYFRPLTEEGHWEQPAEEACKGVNPEDLQACLDNPSHRCKGGCLDYWSKAANMVLPLKSLETILKKGISGEKPKCKFHSFVRTNGKNFAATECL